LDRRERRRQDRPRDDQISDVDAIKSFYSIVFTFAAPAALSARSRALSDRSGGFSTPTRILPSAISRSYRCAVRAGMAAVTNRPITVASMPPSIVSSKMTIRFGHIATIGMPPVGNGQLNSVLA